MFFYEKTYIRNGEFPRKLLSKFKAQLDPIVGSQLDGIVEVQQLGTGNGALTAHADGHQVRSGKVSQTLPDTNQ